MKKWKIALPALLVLGGLGGLLEKQVAGLLLIGLGVLLFVVFSRTKPKAPVRNSQPETVLPAVSTGGKLAKEDYNVAGVRYHADSIKKLQIANEDWRKSNKTLIEEGKTSRRIYHYNFVNKPVRIEHEINSPYDENAMMVFIAGEHVGYISNDEAAHVRAVMETADVKYVTARLSGGEFKIVEDNGEFLTHTDTVRISVRIAYAAP